MNVLDFYQFSDLNQFRCIDSGRACAAVHVGSIFRGNDRHDQSADLRRIWIRRSWVRDVLLEKPDPGVGVVCLRVRAGGVEHAFDRVCGAGDVGPAFDRCERGRDQHHQKANDADDD